MKPKGSSEKWIVCRICLQQPSTGLESIFHQNDEEDLTFMILECGGVPIKKFDHYPDKICTKCLKYLKVAYKFRTTCQRSHKHLSRFIAPVDIDESEEHQMIALVDEDGVDELEFKVEPKDVKEEIETEMVLDMFDVFDDETEEFVQEDKTEEAEYLDELENELFANTSDEGNELQQPKKPPQKVKVKKEKKEKKPESFSEYISIIKEKTIRGPKMRIKKEKPTSFICDVCGNIYPTQGRLNEHIKIHKGIKPYDCEICGHAFAQTQQLTRHMNTHTGQRPYKCTYCPAAFADLSTRNKHHRIHTNERPYVCDVCGKSFTYTNTLKVHKMIHTGEKPHVCDICGKGFPLPTKLRNHRLIHFKNRVSETKEKIMIHPVKLQDNDGNTFTTINLIGI